MMAIAENEAIKIAREFFPKASEDDLGYIVWNETSFPMLPWGIQHINLTPSQDLCRQLVAAKERFHWAAGWAQALERG